MFAFVTSDFRSPTWRQNLAYGQAAALQDHRGLGQPRRLDAALVPGADRLWGRDGAGRRRPARAVEGERRGSARLRLASSSSATPVFAPNPAGAAGQSASGGPLAQSVCCRTRSSPSTRRFSMPAMSACRWCFRWRIAALIEGHVDAAWARWVQALGPGRLEPAGPSASCWARSGLGLRAGVGGAVAVDPVENASFMPWLAATALLHSGDGDREARALAGWTVFLGLVAFTFSMLGAFLVRSGAF